MEVPENMGDLYGNAQELLVTHFPEYSDSRFFKDRVAVYFLKNDSINNIKRKQMRQVCNQKCGYCRRHQLLEVNNSPDSTKFLSRHLTLSMHLTQASARR